MTFEKKLTVIFFLSLVLGCTSGPGGTEAAEAESAEAALLAHYQALAADDPSAEVQYLVLRYWLREEYEMALPRLMEIAEAGHPIAALLISSAYTHGHGIATDAELAAEWKTRAVRALGAEGVIAFPEADV